MARKLNVEDNVIFTGKIEHKDLLKLLCKADDFVMTSYQEGFPTVAYEVASTGIPLIVRDRPVMNGIFTEENAVLVKTGALNEMVKAVMYLLKNKRQSKYSWNKKMKLIRDRYNINVRK